MFDTSAGDYENASFESNTVLPPNANGTRNVNDNDPDESEIESWCEGIRTLFLEEPTPLGK